MPVFDLFSKRHKKKETTPDVYAYDHIPNKCRVQIVQILTDALAVTGDEVYEFVVKVLRREYGMFELWDGASQYTYQHELTRFFIRTKNVLEALDVIELSCRGVQDSTDIVEYNRSATQSEATEAIQELNIRLRENAVGYRFEHGQVVRVDSEYIHSEVVQPVLRVLNDADYSGPQEEFLKAHEHYRSGKTKEAMNECVKALESTLKVICDKQGWVYSNRAAASELLQVCFEKNLVSDFWQSHYSALRSLLESGVPTARNRLSAHGQGATPVDVPEHIASYLIHQTAAAILFLMEAEKRMR